LRNLNKRLESLESCKHKRQGGRRISFELAPVDLSEGARLELKAAKVEGIGDCIREDGEAEAAFARRVYATNSSGKSVKEMTDEELEVAWAGLDASVALEKAKDGRISERSLRRLETRLAPTRTDSRSLPSDLPASRDTT